MKSDINHIRAKNLICCFIIIYISFGRSLILHSQSYQINLKITGAAGIKTQFCYYQGENKYLIQSATFDKNDKLTFKGNDTLPNGIYIIVLENVAYFDFLIKNEYFFSISANKSDIYNTITSKDSKENDIFFRYQKSVNTIRKKIAETDTLITKLKQESDSVKLLNKEKSDYEQDLFRLVDETKSMYPNSYLTKILVNIDKSDPDEIDFSDPDLLRTPFYHNKIRLFIKKNIEKNSSTIIEETSRFLDKLKKSEFNYQYTLGYLLNFYNSFYKNGINQVFVSLADNYFLPDKAKWIKSDALQLLKERRDFLAQGLPGMPAQDLTLESSSGEYISLLQLDSKITLLYFWSVGCSHCDKSTQTLKDKFEALNSKGIKIFAVNVDKDKEAWLKKIEEKELPWINCYDPNEISKYRDKYYVYGSPLLFVINQNKKILSIKNGENEIEEFINQIITK